MEYLVNPVQNSEYTVNQGCMCVGELQCHRICRSNCDNVCTGRYCRAPGAEPQSSSSLNKY